MPLKRSLFGLLAVILIGIQFVPVNRDNPPVRSDVDAPAEVKTLLRRACYDCHSNETAWPWYSRVAPASWFVARHVRRGRADLNFSEWPSLDFRLQDLELAEIHEEIEQGEMPLRSYLWLHPEARLDETERQRLLEWSSVP